MISGRSDYDFGSLHLPQLDVGAIARAVATKTVDADILAQLLFLPGQYLLVTKEDRVTTYKFVSPAALKEAFANEPVDSDWLSTWTEIITAEP
jgi:isopentenyldiphosphate isomerase